MAARARLLVESSDPLRRILLLGPRLGAVGFALWLLLALGTHTAALASPQLSLLPMRRALEAMRSGLHEFFWQEYDVDLVRDPPPTEPEPEPVPEPEPEPELAAPVPPPPPPPKPDDDPYAEPEPPPAPAEAPDVLTQPDDGPSDEPVDLTGFTIVTKKGSTSTGGGFTSAQGTSKQAVHDPNAAVGGTPGGHGTGPPRPPPPPKPARNLSRSAMPRGSTSWSGCPFPPQADLEQIHRAVVEIVVTVGADGRPQAVRVVKDPGYGFAGQARQCALGRSYEPALDVDGRSVAGTTPLLRITFRR